MGRTDNVSQPKTGTVPTISTNSGTTSSVSRSANIIKHNLRQKRGE